MSKKVSDNQDQGYVGEDEFRSWASKMGWYPTKLDQDHGIDFVCQIRGNRAGKRSSEMPGKTLNVSVRSTTDDSDSITIHRDDATLLLSTNTPMVLALVRRAPLDQAGQVAIKFPDEDFIKELDAFSQSSAETHQVRFSEAVIDRCKIEYKVDKLFKEPYADRMARLRAKLRLQGLVTEPHVEIVHTDQGTYAVVRSRDLPSIADISQRSDIANALRDIDMPIHFAAFSLSLSHRVEVTGATGKQFNIASDGLAPAFALDTTNKLSRGDYQVGINERIRDSSASAHIDVLALNDHIHEELAVWNYDKALVLTRKLETAFDSGMLTAELVVPSLLILLARVHIIQAETNRSPSDHIERAKALLTQAEKLLSGNDGEQLADIEALRASIDNQERGAGIALSRLEGRQDPYAVRIRIAILLKQQRVKEAMQVIDGLQLHERWCELATTVYAVNDRAEKAQEIVIWAASLHDRTRYPQCVVRLADALLVRSLARHKENKNIPPRDLSDEEREKLLHVAETLKPVLDPLIVAGKLDSELGACAVKIAWQVNHLLQRREEVAMLTKLMYTRSPVPVDVARSVLSGYIQAPPDLPDRLRQDHPGNLDANILAAVVQSSCMGQHNEAFTQARELVPLADTNEKKNELSKVFQQIWQALEGDNATECERIAASLVAHNPKLRAMFEAATLLRKGNADAAVQLLEKEKSQENVYWLQLYANALLQKRQLGDAVDLLFIAAKKTFDPILLHKTGDLAIQAKKTDIAMWCYEQLVDIQPQNLMARGNLAHIYTFDHHDMEKASVQFRALHSAEPGDPTHAVNLAICLAQLYKPKESLALYDQVCRQEKPDIRAVLGRAELHLSLADPDTAFASLEGFREALWNDPGFLLAYMNTAYAASKEQAAHDALLALDKLRETGSIDPKAFRMVQKDEMLEMFKQSHKQEQDRTQHLHSEMLKGRMPWVWAEQVSGNAIYWGWRRRTQEIPWINDTPENRANFCIYATNGFYARKSEKEICELVPLQCPPAGTKIVADISSLITLHRLRLLDATAAYFGEVMVPAGYLPIILEDSRKLVLYQRSRQQSAELLMKKARDGHITVLEERAEPKADMPIADEYGESDEHRYRLIDLIHPVHHAGLISDIARDRISKICAKPSGIDENHPELRHLQDVIIELQSLETLTHFGLLDAITGYFKVHIKKQARAEIQQRLEAIRYQEETRQWHLDLWNRLRSDSRFHFVPHTVPKAMREKDADPKDYLPFFASFIALETKTPLLADDRVCQALTLNENADSAHAAFGTDVLVSALMDAGKLDPTDAAMAIQQLMVWRYRFILPSAKMLKVIAEQYYKNPPGQRLQEVAEYVHDCMRDTGLFGGPEKTDKGESMAMRLSLSWVSTIAEFLILVWNDESFPEDTAKRLTEWSIQELLPSPPRVLQGRMKTGMSTMTSDLLLSRALINSSMRPGNLRMPDAMKAIKESFKLKDEEYHRIVTGIINDTKRTEPDTDDMRKVLRMMQVRMRNNAMYHFLQIRPRTLVMLQDLDLFEDKIDPIGANIDLPVLQDPNHPRRVKLPDGPLVVYVTEKDKSKGMIVEILSLLYSDLPEVRKTALACLEQMIAGQRLDITPKTRSILEKSHDALLSDIPHEWHPASVTVCDALYDDGLIALQGARQSLECDPVIQDSLNFYVPKVLRPTISSLDSIALDVRNPENEHEQLSEIIRSVSTEAKSLGKACANYFAKVGYLPLAPRYGMGEIVDRWLSAHPDTDAWTEVWAWAHAAFGPIPRYHACFVFVLHPELVPEGKLTDLWKEILSVVHESTGKESDDGRHEAWALRRDLACHYTRHLESLLPDTDSANIGCFALWFSEQVAGLFHDTPDATRFYREKWVKPSSDLSIDIWLAASPHIRKSFLRYATFMVPFPWAIGLLSAMGEKLEQLAPEKQSEEIRAQFHRALVSHLVLYIPFPVQTPDDPTYSLQSSMAETVLKWAHYQPEDERKALEQLVLTRKILSSVDGLCEALRKLSDSKLADQIAVAIALKAKAYTDPSIAEGIWTVLSDGDWRQTVLGAVDVRVLGLLIEAFSILQIENQDKWFSLLPHYIADLCEKTEDTKRRRHLFLYLVHSCLTSDTVSAVRRLLRGDNKDKFLELVKEYREGAESMRSEYPPWVAGKLRGLIANLRVV